MEVGFEVEFPIFGAEIGKVELCDSRDKMVESQYKKTSLNVRTTEFLYSNIHGILMFSREEA